LSRLRSESKRRVHGTLKQTRGEFPVEGNSRCSADIVTTGDPDNRRKGKSSPRVVASERDESSRSGDQVSSALLNAYHAAAVSRCQGVRSHAVPVALVDECSIPLV